MNLKIAAILIYVFMFRYFVFGQDKNSIISSVDGLKVENYKIINVVIENLSEDAKKIGLTNTQILNKVELRLRQSGIQPIDRELNYYLYINCHIVGSAYHLKVTFDRLVFFEVGGKLYDVFGATWNKGITGIHPTNASDIIESIDELMDIFLNEYLKANQN